MKKPPPKYLYEVYGDNMFGGVITFGCILADTDDEAKIAAIKAFRFAKRIQRDHWGLGPMIELDFPVVNPATQ